MKKVSIAVAKQNRNFSQQKLTIGLDLGDRSSWYCVMDEAATYNWSSQMLPPVKLVYLSKSQDADMAAEAFSRGASAYLPKTCAASQLTVAVREQRSHFTQSQSRAKERPWRLAYRQLPWCRT